MTDLKIFAKTVEQSSLQQIKTLVAQPAFSDCKIRIMPDVHTGVGCVIGFTADLGDKVIPNIVGVDIGCGMYTVPLGPIDIDFEKLDRVIRENIPAGMAVQQIPIKPVYLETLKCYPQLKNKEWLRYSLGTLGGGNHFIEVDVDDEGCKYLIIHTGSRNLGKQVAEIWQNAAIKATHGNKDRSAEIIAQLKAEGREKEIAAELRKYKANTRAIPDSLCYLTGVERAQYLSDMRNCQIFATTNRELIAEAIFRKMGWTFYETPFHTVHNYIDSNNMVRKGAISAQKGEQLIIPINMRDGCILGEGLGNPDWNYSAPHGAGRLMSRRQAKETLPLEDYETAMDGIFSTSVSYATIDEAPQVYKPMSEIVDCISETVKIKKILKPVYNFKAGD